MEIIGSISSSKQINAYKYCLIRPEKISISKSFSNKETVKCLGTVKEVAYLGSYTKYLVEVKNYQFYAYMQNSEISEDLKIKWDDKVECSWRDDSIYFFND